MSEVIQELIVELNARTERLEQGLAKARAEIGKTVPAANAAGDAGAKMGAKFGDAATGLAAAAENMVSLGTAGGASMSQLLSQGTTVAAAFGPGGAIVGGSAIAALAVLAIGAAATTMAEEVEGNLRKIEARVPQTAGRMGELRDTIREMSLAGAGHSQADLSGTAAEIARQGVTSLEEIQARLNAVVKVADATGEDMTGIIAGLDQTMDLFGLSADQTEGFLAKLYATAQNRMPITDMLAAFQAAAKTIGDFKIDADTATQALGYLLERGMNAKQASSALKEYAALGKEGAAEIRKLAALYTGAGDALGKLNAAQAKMNDSVEASSAKIRNNLSAVFIDLGDKILPTVTKEMRGLVGILDLLNGTVDKLQGKSDIASMIIGFSTSGKGTSAIDLQKQVYHAAELARDKQLDLGGLSVTDLDRMAMNIMAVTKATGTAESKFVSLTDAIAKARVEAIKLAVDAYQPKNAKPIGAGIRTPDQIKAAQDAAEKLKKQAEDARDKAMASAVKAIEEWQKKVLDAGEQFSKDYSAQLAAAMDDLVDATKKKFAALRALAIAGMIVLPPEFGKLEAQAIANAAAIRDAVVAQDDLAQAQARGEGATAANVAALSASVDQLTAQRKQVKAGSDEWKRLGDELKKVNGELAKETDAAIKIPDPPVDDSSAKRHAEMQIWARDMQQAVDGALQLAQAFGLVDQQIGNSLRALAQIAGSIPSLTDAWGKMGKKQADGSTPGLMSVVGAALPIAGAAASIVSGFLSAAKAAREHAEALRAARVKLSESLTDRNKAMGLNDTERQLADIDKQRKDDIASMLDLLIQQKGVQVGTRTDFLAKDATGQRAVLTNALASAGSVGVREALRAAIEQFDLLAESAKKATAQFEAELAEKRKGIDESLAERRLRLQDRTDEADALAFVTQQEQELAAARAGGVYTAAQLVELQQLQNDEQKKYLADAQKRRDDEAAKKAQDATRTKEDLQTRINSADGETPAEKARRVALEHQRELEDAMAGGADAATLALIVLAQAADDAAAATADAAAAMQAVTEATRALEDLDVRDLRAKGDNAGADALAFKHQQEREYQDAVAAGRSQEYLDHLKTTQAAEATQYATDHPSAGAGPAGAAGGADASGATSASGTGIGTATIVQVDRMLGLLGTIETAGQGSYTELVKHTALLSRLALGAALAPITAPNIPAELRGAQSVTMVQLGGVRVSVNVIAPDGMDPNAFGLAISRAVLAAIDAGLGNSALLSALGRGDVGR